MDYDGTGYDFHIPLSFNQKIWNDYLNGLPIYFRTGNSMAEVPSVKFEVPTIEMQETIIKHVTPFMDSVTAAGKRGGIFTVLTKDDQGRMIGNAVVAVKVGDSVEIAGYIGKTWGTKNSMVYGVESRIFF